MLVQARTIEPKQYIGLFDLAFFVTNVVHNDDGTVTIWTSDSYGPKPHTFPDVHLIELL